MSHSIQAKRMQTVKASPSVAARALVEKLRSQGRQIISLTVGEPDFNTPNHIIEAAYQAAKSGQTHYTGVNGTPALQQAIVDKFARENNLHIKPENIAVGCGAKQLIYSAFAASLDNDDEVIVPAPYWVSYPDMVLLQGGKPVSIATTAESGFKITAEQLEQAITPKTKWLVLNTPNNPSGAIYSAAELTALFAVLKKHPQVWVMTDEIYEHFVYGDSKFVAPATVDTEIAKRCLTINGVSKAYAMTGWRIGYCCGPVEIIKPIKTILSQSTTCPSSVSQVATVEALNNGSGFVKQLAAEFASRRALFSNLLNNIEGIDCYQPEGAFYVFPNITNFYNKKTTDGQIIQSDIDFASYLAEEAGVATIAGESFGMGGHIRCSFAVDKQSLETAAAAINKACQKLT